MALTIPLILLVLHFLADFTAQSDWMAINKSKSNHALTIHCLCYSLFFALFGAKFAVATFVTHWVTDYWTSRLTSKLWFFKSTDGVNFTYIEGPRHWFFVAIGFDQLIHAFTLAVTFKLLQ
jgi:hypothetical protein